MKIKLFNIPMLALIVLCMFAFRYGFLTQQDNFVPFLNEWQYALMVLSCVLIAAGGFFMDNIFGYGRERNSGISEAMGYNIYIAINLVALGIGYYIANLGNKPMYTGAFIVAAASLYLYATSLKQSLIISNIVLALVMTLPLVAISIFNIYYALTPDNFAMARLIFQVILDYIIFTFIISLILTFINDLANSDADYNAGLSTLPIVLGRARATKLVFGFTVIPAVLVLYYCKANLTGLPLSLGYVLVFMAGPLIYALIKLWNATGQKDFRHLEIVFKLIFLFTAVSIAVITFNIKSNGNATDKTEGVQTDTGIGLAPQAAVSKGA